MSTNQVTLDGEALGEVEAFIYLDSTIKKQGEYYTDVKAHIADSRRAFIQLKNIWNSEEMSTSTTVRIAKVIAQN